MFQFCSSYPGPYTALKRHFREQHGIKTSNTERNGDIFCGQNGCTLKVLTFANFRYHLSVCQKNAIILEDVSVNCVDANVENHLMNIDLPHGGFVADLEEISQNFSTLNFSR